MRVLNFGSLNLDYVYEVPHFVAPGETLSAAKQSVNPGGKGLNQSVALARAGADVYHAGVLGNGGAMLRDVLEASGVHTDYLATQDVVQGNAVIQVAPSGENCIILYGGSNQCITDEQVDETLAHFDAGDWLILQNEINANSRIVEAAHARGMKIVLNPSPFDARLDDVAFGKLTWLMVNEVEAEQMTGHAQPDEAWRVIHKKWPHLSCVFTLGADGSVAFRVDEAQNGALSEAESTTRPECADKACGASLSKADSANKAASAYKAARAALSEADGTPRPECADKAERAGGVERREQAALSVKAVDTTAAGDTFTGYFVAEIMQGATLSRALQMATTAAAISVTRAGAAASVPERREVII